MADEGWEQISEHFQYHANGERCRAGEKGVSEASWNFIEKTSSR